jgi:hypothetical protein
MFGLLIYYVLIYTLQFFCSRSNAAIFPPETKVLQLLIDIYAISNTWDMLYNIANT